MRLASHRRRRRIVARGLVLVGIQTCRQGHQRRPAQGRWHISAAEKSTLQSELIEMRRLNRVVPHKSIVGEALVIGNDENDIRFFGSNREPRPGHQREEKENPEFHFSFYDFLLVRTRTAFRQLGYPQDARKESRTKPGNRVRPPTQPCSFSLRRGGFLF